MEEEIVAALRIIESHIERVALVYANGSSEQHTRIPKARIADQDNPIPLRSLGEGMVRLFGLALALVNTRDGLFLIDEIESGLHYSVQPDVWRLVFRLAQRLNIQVFATTHSWDCVEAFQFVTGSHPDEGQLIRLGRNHDDVIATLFDEQELAIITRDHIEVR